MVESESYFKSLDTLLPSPIKKCTHEAMESAHGGKSLCTRKRTWLQIPQDLHQSKAQHHVCSVIIPVLRIWRQISPRGSLDSQPSRCGEFRFQWETLSHKMRWKAIESDTKCWFLDSKYTYIGKYACTHTSTTHTHTHTQPNTQVHPHQPLRSGSFHPNFAKNWVVMESQRQL